MNGTSSRQITAEQMYDLVCGISGSSAGQMHITEDAHARGASHELMNRKGAGGRGGEKQWTNQRINL